MLLLVPTHGQSAEGVRACAAGCVVAAARGSGDDSERKKNNLHVKLLPMV